MAYTVLQIVNKAGGKIGGFGDQLGGKAFLKNLTGTDKVTLWCNEVYPQVRKQVIIDLALLGCPFRETVKYADLGDDLKANDIVIADISIGVTPLFTVTIETDEAHGFTTGDTVMLFDIEGTNDIDTLNNVLYDITVVTATTFTLDDIVGVSTWTYTEDSGTISEVPEIGGWKYAFNLPSDCIAVSKQLDEIFSSTTKPRQEYQQEVILNADKDGELLLTNNYSNAGGDSAFIEYAIDQETVATFKFALVECIATKLAAELCPILGKNMETRQKVETEYRMISVPNAQAFNQTQQNNSAKVVPDFLGGRAKTLRPI